MTDKKYCDFCPREITSDEQFKIQVFDNTTGEYIDVINKDACVECKDIILDKIEQCQKEVNEK